MHMTNIAGSVISISLIQKLPDSVHEDINIHLVWDLFFLKKKSVDFGGFLEMFKRWRDSSLV